MEKTAEKPGNVLPIEILVVEDNAGDALLLLKCLESSKFPNRVTVVRDGSKATDFLKKTGNYSDVKRPDLVFLDLNLPRKDGRVVLREMKQDPDLKDIPVLVLTTSSWTRDIDDAYNFNANFYLIKPPDLEQFLASMKYVEDVWLRTIVPGGL